MRRSDKEVTDRSQIDQIIMGSHICHLGMAVNNEPYVIPISFGYDGEALYFHTARKGRKIDFILTNPRVCFQVERNVQNIANKDCPCGWTFFFESVVGYGTITELTSSELKIYALNQIMFHYSNRKWIFTSANLKSVRTWRISVDSLTGKRSKGL